MTTQGDAMQRLLLLVILTSGAAASANSPECPAGFKNRTPAQVLADHRAALAVGDVTTDVNCNYAEDAVVISDQGTTAGRENIFMALSGLVNFFGGVVPVVTDEQSVAILNNKTHMVRLLFTITVPCVSIPDGIDTYVIEKGQIQAQTAHGFPIFTCGPPPA
jgi:hypothetical protein